VEKLPEHVQNDDDAPVDEKKEPVQAENQMQLMKYSELI